jgi:hypothetical protein
MTISAASIVYAFSTKVTAVLWHLKLIMCTLYVCVFFWFYLFKGICITMLVTDFSVTSFQTRTFISCHTIVSHYVPSITQNNTALKLNEQHWLTSLDSELALTSACNSLQERQQMEERPEHGYNYSFPA